MILVTNVYAPIDLPGKLKLWEHIRHVRSYHTFLPWIVARDFNSILTLAEKRGEMACLGPSSKLFQKNIDLLHLSDVKPLNGIFTGNNRRVGNDAISECLDRFLVSCFWNCGSLSLSSKILDWRGSDHWPIKLIASYVVVPTKPLFKFQLMWLQDSSLHDLMAHWWRQGGPTYGTAMFSFSKKLQYVKKKLKHWNRNCFGNLHIMKKRA